jgi:glycosyltransferase involved in cell wall biosynthesis
MSMSRKGRILFVVGSLAVGGAESQLVMLAERLKMRGWSIIVFPLIRSGPLLKQLEQAGIHVSDGGYNPDSPTRMRMFINLCACQARLIGCLLRARPDVVHGFLPLANFMTALAGRIACVPRIITSKRALGRHQDRTPIMKWLDWTANALSHRITANSQAVARDTEARDGYDLSRIVVIPNGLDFSRFGSADRCRDETRNKLWLSKSDVAIAMVANLIPYKGHKELIEAFSRVGDDKSRLRLFLIGRDEGMAQDLMDTARRLGVANRMDLMGQRSDVSSLLSAMDIGVLASHEEGFSNALLEKLAAGLPVVATDVGGNPEALEGMPDCVLVKPQDAEDLSRGLASLINRLAATVAGRETRQLLVRERYSVDAMVDAYERLYEDGRKRAVE